MEGPRLEVEQIAITVRVLPRGPEKDEAKAKLHRVR